MNRRNTLRNSLWLPFLGILGLAVLTYLPYISNLGFYLDDWPNLYFQLVQGGQGTNLFHAYDGRPLSGWFYQVLFAVLGFKPLAWQIFTLGMRVLTTAMMMLVLLHLWPARKKAISMAALLFMVYPLFMQQPIAITFSAHWVSFFFVLFSFYLMFLSVRWPEWFWPLTLLGMAVSALGFILEEFFIGIELLRPLLLFYYWSNHTPLMRKRSIFILKHWVPYLLVWLAFVVWRTSFIQLPVPDRNETVILSQFLADPVKQGLQLLQWAVQDFVQTLAFTWTKTIDPALFTIATPAQALAWITALVAGVSIYFLSGWSWLWKSSEDLHSPHFFRQALLLGILAILLGAAPGWLVNRQVSSVNGLWNDRFGLAGMLGASIVFIALIEARVQDPKIRRALISVLICLAVGFQSRNLNDYRWSWTYQTRFFSQLHWRAPSLQPDTLILSDQEIFSKMGVYPTSFAINSLYPQSDPRQADYWFLTIVKYFGKNMEQMLAGEETEQGVWQAEFKGNTRQSVVIRYDNTDGSCLWVLSEQDALNPLLEDATRMALSVSDLTRISENETTGYPPADILSVEPVSSWCYYYQKADLARQYARWGEVNKLWDEAQARGLNPNVTIELTPFIEAAIQTGRWDQAFELSNKMYKTVESVGPYLCSIWDHNQLDTKLPANVFSAYQAFSSEINCEAGD